MQELKKAFEKHTHSYATFLKEVHEEESRGMLTRVFACQDIFFLEPFYPQMENISMTKMKRYSRREDLPGGLDVYEFLIEDGVVLYSRHTDATGMVKDGFYVREGHDTWKYEFYLSSETCLTNIMRLHLDENGRVSEYTFFNKFGWYKRSYENLDNIVMISTASSSTSSRSKTKVILDDELNTVKKIELLYDDENVVLYEKKKRKVSEATLRKKVKKLIIDSTLKMLKEQDMVKKEIAFLVFVYGFERPFEPEVGLCQSSEKEALSEYGPLAVYSVGDMEYFAEPTLSLALESQKDVQELLDDLHRSINSNYEYAEKKQVIIDAYVEICQALMNEPVIKEYIPVAKDFYILAYDDSELNAEVYLQALYPKTHYKAFLRQAEEEASMAFTKKDKA